MERSTDADDNGWFERVLHIPSNVNREDLPILTSMLTQTGPPMRKRVVLNQPVEVSASIPISIQ